MHVTSFKAYQETWTIVHHSDWSGEATIYKNDEVIARLPGELLKMCGWNAALDAMISYAESLEK